MNRTSGSLFSSEIMVGTSLFSQLPSFAFPLILVVILLFIVLSLWFIWRRPSAHSLDSENTNDQLPINSTASTRPLFPRAEATVFNMIRLAVQDRYLVLAKLPLLTVLSLDEKDPESRKTIIKTIQHVKLDLALIHPGSLQLEKVIRFTRPEGSTTLPLHKEQLISTILESANIPTTEIDANQSYTVPQLLTLLELADED